MNAAIASTLVILGSCFLTGAYAQNLQFLERSPVAALTEEDKAALGDALTRILNGGLDGEGTEWRNDATGHSGTVQVLETHEDLGTVCRTVRTRTRAGGLDGGGRYRLCRAEDGSWRFAPLRKPAETGSEQDE